MLSSTPSPKFLLDENVRIELFRFLKQNKFDVKLVPNSASDSEIATISKNENRILVTNDEDFIELTQDKIFAVVWLRIPQHDSKAQVSSFGKLVKNLKDFSAKLVILRTDGWDDLPLGQK